MAIILGYHGCDFGTAQLLLGGAAFVQSAKPYDWLGTGAYFWEADAVRAYEWALEHKPEQPCVVGAVIELGNCLDLTTRTGVQALRDAFLSYTELQKESGLVLPANKAAKTGRLNDLVLRFLDNAVVDHLHSQFDKASRLTGGAIRQFDTVRALFPEGEPVYENAGFWEKTHVQIAVRHPAQVRGVFRVPEQELRSLGIPDLYS